MTRAIPESRGSPVLGHLLQMRRDPLGLLSALTPQYDGLVLLHVGPRKLYLVSDPELAHELLHKNQQALTKNTIGMRQIALIVGQGLLTSDGDFWKRQRRIAQPAFHRQRLAGFASTMVEVGEGVRHALTESLRASQPIDINRQMMACTLSIVSRTLLGADLSRDASAVADALDCLLHEARRRTVSPWRPPLFIPTPGNIRFNRALRRIDSMLERLIAERVDGRARGDDLLQMLVDAVDEETGERMNASQLRDEVVTMFIAGHETTASALAWTFFLLANHQPALARLHEELDAVLGGRAPTLEDLPRLPWLSQVLDESMRLYPPAWVFARQTSAPVEIGGYAIDADRTVLVSPWAIHRNPRYWPEPLAFEPERFAPERVATHHKLQYLPFGSASRMCIGRGFALMEAKLVLATLAQAFAFELAPGHTVVAQPSVTLRPKSGVYLNLRAR